MPTYEEYQARVNEALDKILALKREYQDVLAVGTCWTFTEMVEMMADDQMSELGLSIGQDASDDEKARYDTRYDQVWAEIAAAFRDSWEWQKGLSEPGDYAMDADRDLVWSWLHEYRKGLN